MKDRVDQILQRKQAEYLESILPVRDALLEQMEAYATETGQPIADPEVAQFLRVLIRARRPERVLEVGTNIGYSVVVMGRELVPGATLETIEIDRAILEKARRFVDDAALPCRVIFHEGAALDIIERLDGPFDLAFIDCVKTEYEAYLDALLSRMESGGVIVCDNLLWKGWIAEGKHDTNTDALRAFNERITTDPRLVTSILPLGDGTGVSVVR